MNMFLLPALPRWAVAVYSVTMEVLCLSSLSALPSVSSRQLMLAVQLLNRIPPSLCHQDGALAESWGLLDTVVVSAIELVVSVLSVKSSAVGAFCHRWRGSGETSGVPIAVTKVNKPS